MIVLQLTGIASSNMVLGCPPRRIIKICHVIQATLQIPYSFLEQFDFSVLFYAFIARNSTRHDTQPRQRGWLFRIIKHLTIAGQQPSQIQVREVLSNTLYFIRSDGPPHRTDVGHGHTDGATEVGNRDMLYSSIGFKSFFYRHKDG